MDGREIPGFYFDEVKKKYFAILPSHAGPRPESPFADAAINKRRNRSRKRKIEAAFSQREHRETVRSISTVASRGITSLDREVGRWPRKIQVKDDWSQSCVYGFNKTTVADYAHVRYFDINPVTRTLYVANEDTTIERLHLKLRGSPLRNEDFAVLRFPQSERIMISGRIEDRSASPPAASHYSSRHDARLHAMTSQVSSMNLLPASGSLVTTTLGSDRHPVIHISNPEQDGPGIAEQYSPTNESTIWTSAPRPPFCPPSNNSVPPTVTETVAIGASSAMYFITRPPSGTWSHEGPIKFSSDVQALSWLSPTTLALGCRDTAIHIYDTRSKASAQVLSHGSPVSALKVADDPTRIVCAGLEDNLALYDLRMPKLKSDPQLNNNQRSIVNDSSTVSKSRGRKRNKREVRHASMRGVPDRAQTKNMTSKWQRSEDHQTSSSSVLPSSIPILTFPYSNAAHNDLGLDVHAELGLVASADDSGSVLLFSLQTGNLLKKWDADSNGVDKNPRGHDRVRCIRFIDGEEHGVGVWSTLGGAVVRFAW